MIISDLYQTKITCSKYRAKLSDTITVTVKLEDFNKSVVTGKSVTITVDYGKIVSVTKGGSGSVTSNGKSATATTTTTGEIAVSYQAQDWGLCTFSVNNVTSSIYVTGWKNVTVDGDGNSVTSNALNGVTYIQYANEQGLSVVLINGTLTADSTMTPDAQGKVKRPSLAFLNPAYVPLGQSGTDKNVTFGMLHNKGQIFGKVEYNTVQDNTAWRVMLINYSSTKKPSVSGRIEYYY